MRLAFPPGTGNISLGGVEVALGEGGVVEVPDHFAADFIKFHGARDASVPEIVTEQAADGEPESDPDKMTRTQMFAFLKGAGVAATLPIKNDELRALVKEAIATASQA